MRVFEKSSMNDWSRNCTPFSIQSALHHVYCMRTVPTVTEIQCAYSSPLGLHFLYSFAQAQLDTIFPNQRVFMRAAQFLLNPRNHLWDRITRAYAHLSHKDLVVGIQVWAPLILTMPCLSILEFLYRTERLCPYIKQDDYTFVSNRTSVG